MDKFFSIPVIWYPGSEELGSFEEQVGTHFNRAIATREWLDGKLSTSDFFDFLDYQGLNPFAIAEDWADGFSYAAP